jgi:hypothetical protein
VKEPLGLGRQLIVGTTAHEWLAGCQRGRGPESYGCCGGGVGCRDRVGGLQVRPGIGIDADAAVLQTICAKTTYLVSLPVRTSSWESLTRAASSHRSGRAVSCTSCIRSCFYGGTCGHGSSAAPSPRSPRRDAQGSSCHSHVTGHRGSRDVCTVSNDGQMYKYDSSRLRCW